MKTTMTTYEIRQHIVLNYGDVITDGASPERFKRMVRWVSALAKAEGRTVSAVINDLEEDLRFMAE